MYILSCIFEIEIQGLNKYFWNTVLTIVDLLFSSDRKTKSKQKYNSNSGSHNIL